MSKKTFDFKIDPNQVKVRDPLMRAIISGVTKAGVQPDQKKRRNKDECRKKVRYREEE